MKTQRLAAIDIGSNSLKLAIVEAAASDSFTIISQDRERVRLGHDTLRNKFLSDEAIALSIDAVARFKSISETREADEIIAVATASVREARNAAQFVREVEKATGVHVEILPSMEEARLIGVAVTQFFGKENEDTLINIDIGGGSTEISLMEDGEPKKLFSMKLGAVGLTEKYLLDDPPTKKQIKALRKEIRFALEQPRRKIEGEVWDMSIGTSGTILALASMLSYQNPNDLTEKPRIKFKQLVKLNKRLAGMSVEERTRITLINERRAEVILAGGQILEGVMETLGIGSLETCPYALREGVIIDHLRKSETESLPPVPDVDDIKLRDVFAVGRRFGYEENHALQVATMAEKLFDRLAPVFGLERYERTLLSAAALLHDVGYHISHEAHHKHSLYLIKYSEMTGFTEAEKSVIANIARYHRKALPKETHSDFTALGEKERETVWKLSSILRLADGLDRGYESRVRDIEIVREGDRLTLTLVSDEDCSSEIYAIEMKKESFEQTYGCDLIVRQTFQKDKPKEAAKIA
jgi:exopolyphosphatase / guanosine-5'-triphosphate,3'-diphosphate pyrophosphatase